MKFKMTRQLFCHYDESNDQEHYACIFRIENDTPNASKSQTIVVHTGIYHAEMQEDPNYRLSGGTLTVFTNQTDKQVANRMKTYLRGFAARASEVREFGDIARLKEVVVHYFGDARAKSIVKAAELNLHYMERPDGSIVMDGEPFNPEEVVSKVSIDAEPKPVGWGAW